MPQGFWAAGVIPIAWEFISVFAFRAFLNFTDGEVDFSVSILVILGYFLRRKRAEIILLSNPFPKPS